MENKTPTTPGRDWKNIVDSSKGTMFFVPGAVLEKTKAWQNRRLAFTKQANSLAKEEAEIGMMFQDIIHSLRKHFEDVGAPENVWMCDIGFNTEALKEGQFIINVARAERSA